MSRVLVTDAQMRSSVAVIRSLGSKGIEVTAAEETRFATGFFSKYSSDHVVYPSPKKDSDEFINYLLDLLEKGQYDMIFPVADACLKPVIDNWESISKHTKIALTPPEIFIKGYDKGETLKIAIKEDIPCPETFFIDDFEELSVIQDNLEYPLVIKPRISSGSRGVKICNTWDELAFNFKKLNSIYDKLLIQEYIPFDGELGVYTLFNRDSQPRNLTVQKRIRSYPVSGGPSTLRKTIKNDISKQAIETSFKLLRHMGWVGVGMVEFRIDARDGSLKLMEVNPRFWGSLQLSILAGADFPYRLYQMIMQGDVEEDLNYKENTYCRWFLPGEILWYLNAPDKLKNIKKLLDFSVPDDILSWNDPGPTFGFFLATLRYITDKDMWKFVLRREND
jgi:predicted ATP-grasp superfamily ATP-dependent carboligase